MKCENCGKEVDKLHKWASIQQEARKTFCCSRECSIALTKRWNTQDCVRTLLADEEFCERMARELFCQFEMGDGNMRERCEEMWDSISPKEKSTTANWIVDAKQALRNAAGIKEKVR